MAQKKIITSLNITPIVTAFVIAAVVLVYIVAVVQQGVGTTQTRASRKDFLTIGDDALSLQEDLSRLDDDPGMFVEEQLVELE